MAIGSFKQYFEEYTIPEPWQQTRAAYLKPYQDALKSLDDRYQQAWDQSMPAGDYPANGTIWQRWDYDGQNAMGRQDLRTTHARLIKEREKARIKLSAAERRHKKSVKSAVRQGLPVPPEVLQDYPK